MSKEKPIQALRREIVLYEEPQLSAVSDRVVAMLGLSEQPVVSPFGIVKVLGEKRKKIAMGMAGDAQVG